MLLTRRRKAWGFETLSGSHSKPPVIALAAFNRCGNPKKSDDSTPVKPAHFLSVPRFLTANRTPLRRKMLSLAERQDDGFMRVQTNAAGKRGQASRIFGKDLVELRGFEPLTSAVRLQRSPI